MFDLRGFKGRTEFMTLDKTTPDDGVITTRKKMVNLNLAFTCDTDEEALAVKAKVNAVVAEFPNIQVMFNITERPMA